MKINDFLTGLFGQEAPPRDPPSQPPEWQQLAYWALLHSGSPRLDDYLQQADALIDDDWSRDRLVKLASFQAIQACPPVERARIALAGLQHQVNIARSGWDWQKQQQRHDGLYMPRFVLSHALQVLTKALLSRRLPFEIDDLALLIQEIAGAPQVSGYSYSLKLLCKQTRWAVARHGRSQMLVSALEALKGALSPSTHTYHSVEALLAQVGPQVITPVDPWAEALLCDLATMPPARKEAWETLLRHAFAIPAALPSAAWRAQALELVGLLDEGDFNRMMNAWFTSLKTTDAFLAAHSQALLKGIFWLAAQYADEPLASVMGAAGLACYQRIRRRGLRARRAGDACLHALAEMDGRAPLIALLRIRRLGIKADFRRRAGKALLRAAQRRGLEIADIEERAVPDYGLDSSGCARRSLGSYTAEVSVTGGNRVLLNWIDDRGKRRRSTPAEVCQNMPQELDTIKAFQKELRQELSVQRDRVEQLLLGERSWRLADWRAWYHDHPLVGRVARNLIWAFESAGQTTLGIYRQGNFVNIHGQALEWLSPDSQTPDCKVSLWQPLGFKLDTILTWRLFLENSQTSQPFKQAHREIYILTEAELETESYSNRFAAHILDTRAFTRQCKRRGWFAKAVVNSFGGSGRATFTLPQTAILPGLRAELWLEQIDYQEEFLITDQVRFYSADNQLMPLIEVPAIVFSEVMRAVDLFVGRCSLGNDPNWQDRGRRADLRDYWHRYAFGDLSASAQTRADVLERLLPRLKIGPQCQIHGRFLHVHGQLRSYKIHLGSGNVLLAPEDRYLCIVADRSARLAGRRLFLPFGDDHTLTLILSKAFLLAKDGEIKDAAILRQIKQRQPARP